jgi:hypothetical protein
MKVKIKHMSNSELNDCLCKVQSSLLDNKERGEFYDAIHKRRAELNFHEAEATHSEMTMNEMGMD